MPPLTWVPCTVCTWGVVTCTLGTPGMVGAPLWSESRIWWMWFISPRMMPERLPLGSPGLGGVGGVVVGVEVEWVPVSRSCPRAAPLGFSMECTFT